jgi:hypothetical protein
VSEGAHPVQPGGEDGRLGRRRGEQRGGPLEVGLRHEADKLVTAGWVPVELLYGLSIGVRHGDYRTRAQTRSRSNTEVSGWSELVQAVRSDARAHLSAQTGRRGGDGVRLPSRYVSGYLHPEKVAELHHPVAGQSHAWIEYWAGGWCGYDPTNRTRADESHVVVGRGRDYDDVPPHKGVYRGVAGGPPEVTVEFTQVA